MAVDTTFEFEKRRNRPVKYDRNLMGKTIVAMQKVSAIRVKREERFFANRMKDAKRYQKAYARAEIKKGIEILAPAVSKREEIIRNILDSARNRIATRKKGKKVLASGESDDNKMEE